MQYSALFQRHSRKRYSVTNAFRQKETVGNWKSDHLKQTSATFIFIIVGSLVPQYCRCREIRTGVGPPCNLTLQILPSVDLDVVLASCSWISRGFFAFLCRDIADSAFLRLLRDSRHLDSGLVLESSCDDSDLNAVPQIRIVSLTSNDEGIGIAVLGKKFHDILIFLQCKAITSAEIDKNALSSLYAGILQQRIGYSLSGGIQSPCFAFSDSDSHQ